MTTKSKKGSGKRPSQQTAEKKSFPVIPVVFGTLGLLLILVIVFAGSASIEAAEVEVTGTNLAPLLSNDDPAIGELAATIVGEDFDGNRVAIEPDGNPKVVMFLAHWCSFCQAEVPVVQAWLNAGGLPAGTEMIAVSTSVNAGRDNYPPSAWLEREGFTAPVIADSEDGLVAQAFGMSGTPFYAFLDGDNNLVRRVSGQIDPATIGAILSAIASGA
ncbi:MAG: TlpA family protein disulfide reductase [Acidimicrobiia bacterium]|nr:TlpA family protein disulfide reductase [Acidimicrobiia bacterium]NNC75874.1 TlpA family protein disulfide reductase [Acidimicrobiia bacterium]